MAPPEKVVGLYASLYRGPYKFAVKTWISSGHYKLDVYTPYTVKDFVAQTLTVLHRAAPDLMEKIAKLDDDEFQKSPHKTRRYVADRKDLLYINSPHLTEKHSMRVLGYWVATNIGRKEASHIFHLACKAAGQKYEPLSSVSL